MGPSDLRDGLMVENTDSLNPSAAPALTAGGKGQGARGRRSGGFMAPAPQPCCGHSQCRKAAGALLYGTETRSLPACPVGAVLGWGVALRNSSSSNTQFQTLAAACQLNP